MWLLTSSPKYNEILNSQLFIVDPKILDQHIFYLCSIEIEIRLGLITRCIIVGRDLLQLIKIRIIKRLRLFGYSFLKHGEYYFCIFLKLFLFYKFNVLYVRRVFQNKNKKKLNVFFMFYLFFWFFRTKNNFKKFQPKWPLGDVYL